MSEQNNYTLFISDRLLANGQICHIDSQCYSGKCRNNHCEPIINREEIENRQEINDRNSNNIPWWGWLLIVLFTLIIIAYLIYFLHRTNRTPGSTSDDPIPTINQPVLVTKLNLVE